MFRRCATLLLTLLAAAMPLAASADTYPSRSIRLIVGFQPGGGNDMQARLVAQKLTKMLGQTVIVENKPGADAIIASEYVAKSPPDGYTLYVGASGAMTFNPGLYQKLPYDPLKDFIPVIQIASFPLVLAVNPNVKATTLGQFIALAKAKPGKLNYASGSSPFQVASELFKKQAGIDLTHVPYKGSSPSIVATMAGETDMVTVDLPPALVQIRAGKLQGLAVTSPKRSPVLPELPTVAESGLANFDVVLWSGIFAPAGTPKAIVDKLYESVAQVLKMEDIKTRLLGYGYEPGVLNQAEFSAVLKADVVKWSKVARDANIRAD